MIFGLRVISSLCCILQTFFLAKALQPYDFSLIIEMVSTLFFYVHFEITALRQLSSVRPRICQTQELLQSVNSGVKSPLTCYPYFSGKYLCFANGRVLSTFLVSWLGKEAMAAWACRQF